MPEIIKPLFEKYASVPGSEWLFNFHERHTTSDSFSANVNIGIRKICESMGIAKENWYCVYTFRHTWGTVAQNDCGASISEVAFGMNHSAGHRITRGYIKLDFTPAWELNERVVDFIFFTDKESKFVEKEDKTFERISKYNNKTVVYNTKEQIAAKTPPKVEEQEEVHFHQGR